MKAASAVGAQPMDIMVILAAQVPSAPKGHVYLKPEDVDSIQKQYPNLECWQRDAYEEAPHRLPGRMAYTPMEHGEVLRKGAKHGTPPWQPYAYNKLTGKMVPIVKEAPALKREDARTLLKKSVFERWNALCDALLAKSDPGLELQLSFMPAQLAQTGYIFGDPHMRAVMEQGAAARKPVLRFSVEELNGLKTVESALRVERKAVARVARDLRREALMEEAAQRDQSVGDAELSRQTDKLYPWLGFSSDEQEAEP